jgi:hypothetical protein
MQDKPTSAPQSCLSGYGNPLLSPTPVGRDHLTVETPPADPGYLDRDEMVRATEESCHDGCYI